jgi:hypothetical protein
MKPIRATIVLLWIFIPWVPVVLYDIATQDSIEGANIGAGMLGFLALITTAVGLAVYIGRRGN